MARRFNGTSDYLEHGVAVVGAVPITMACWFWATNLTAATTRALISIGDSAADTRVIIFALSGSVKASGIAVGGAGGDAVTSAGPTRGVWQHCCGVFASSTDRRVFLNGRHKGTNNTSGALGTPTVTTIGARYAGGVRGGFFDGFVAEAAVWNVALDDADVYLLARGYYPDQIRPGNLVSYWDLEGQSSPNEIDLNRFDATVFGAKPAISEHPPMLPRTRRHRALEFMAGLPSPVFQFARPDSDITPGNWTPSSGGDLFAMVDEVTANDADRIRSNTGSSDDAVTLGLSGITTPVAGDVSITIRHRIGT